MKKLSYLRPLFFLCLFQSYQSNSQAINLNNNSYKCLNLSEFFLLSKKKFPEIKITYSNLSKAAIQNYNLWVKAWANVKFAENLVKTENQFNKKHALNLLKQAAEQNEN